MKIKRLFCCIPLFCALCAVPLHAAPASTAPGYVDFGKFEAPAEGQFVDVNIQKSLIGMVARLAEKEEPAVAELLRGLEAVRVHVIAITEDNRDELRDRARSVRERLADRGWESVATVHDNREEVGVFVKLKGDEAIEGLAVTVLSGDREAVFVNVVGNIRPEQVAELGERLNLKPLRELSRKLGGH